MIPAVTYGHRLSLVSRIAHTAAAGIELDRAGPKLPAAHQRRAVLRRVLQRSPLIHRYAKRLYGAANFLLRRPHESDFKLFSHFDGRPGLFVDIGANCGQSARSFRIYNRSYKIVSFEPNRLLAPDLRWTRALLGRTFRFELYGLGDRRGQATLWVPVVGGTPHTAWASVDPQSLETNRKQIEQELGGTFHLEQVRIDIRRFDEFDLAPDVIKIDVEGLELEVLRGMGRTLALHAPLLMIECNSSEGRVVPFLRERNYRIFEYLGREDALRETSWPDLRNYFAIAEHKLGETAACGIKFQKRV